MIKQEGSVYFIEDGAFTYFWFKVPGYKYYFLGSANVMEGPVIESNILTETQLNDKVKELYDKALQTKREELKRFEKDRPSVFGG